MILSTKKLRPESIAGALEKNIRIFDKNFIEIRLVNNIPQPRFRTLIFTSTNAVLAFSKLRDRTSQYNAFCTSGNTFKSLSEIENVKVIDTAPDADSLARKIIKAGNYREVSFFCGNLRRDDLPKKLADHDIIVEEIIAYETMLTPHIIKDHFDAVLFFSPSAVHSFFRTNLQPNNVINFCIGETTAAAVKPYTSNEVVIAKAPAEVSLLQGVEEFLEKKISNYE